MSSWPGDPAGEVIALRWRASMSHKPVQPVRTIPRIVPAKTVVHSDDFRSEDRTVLDTELPKRFAEGTHHEKDKRKPAPTPQNVIPFTKPRAIAALAAANPNAVVVHKKDALIDAPTNV